MPIELGNVTFDEAKVFKQLRNDLKDDWFPDPVGYKDMIAGGLVEAALQRNFDRNHGLYIPAQGEIYNIPKHNHTLRYGIEFGLPDRLLYHALASALVPYFDPLLPWFVFSHRGAKEAADRYLFRRGIPAWKDFIGSVRSALGSHKFLLSTDLSNYFEYIDIMKLKASLNGLIPNISATPKEKSSIRAHIQLLFDCLRVWSFDGSRGLPQNRDASSFLANIYMSSVDKRMEELGYTYFRYMDDIKIICDNEFAARRALKQLILALRDIGASVNSKKTVLCAASDNDQVAKCLDAGTPDIERLDALWASRSEKIIRRTFPELQHITVGLLNQGSVDSREFRYCLTRLSLLAGCEEFAVPTAYFDPVTDKIMERIPYNPAATDQFAKFLQVAPMNHEQLSQVAAFLDDPEKSFYSWQNYRLWSLLGQKGFKDDTTLNQATDIVTSGVDDATRAGATIYSGALGGKEKREIIANRFPSLRTFLGQRSAIVATHELPFKGAIEKSVKPHVRPDLDNVYRRMRETSPGVYFIPPEPVSITKIVDSERDYD